MSWCVRGGCKSATPGKTKVRQLSLCTDHHLRPAPWWSKGLPLIGYVEVTRYIYSESDCCCGGELIHKLYEKDGSPATPMNPSAKTPIGISRIGNN